MSVFLLTFSCNLLILCFLFFILIMSGSLVCFFSSDERIDHLHGWVRELELELFDLSQRLRTERDPDAFIRLQESERVLRVELLFWLIKVVNSECEVLLDNCGDVPAEINLPVDKYGFFLIPDLIEELRED